jgi:hypothetical protein
MFFAGTADDVESVYVEDAAKSVEKLPAYPV